MKKFIGYALIAVLTAFAIYSYYLAGLRTGTLMAIATIGIVSITYLIEWLLAPTKRNLN